MATEFLPHLELGDQKKLVTISSQLGSIERNTWGGLYIYRSSKAALNQATVTLAREFEKRGWFKTKKTKDGHLMIKDLEIPI